MIERPAMPEQVWIGTDCVPEFGIYEADTTYGDNRDVCYRRDDPADPLVRLSEVEAAVLDAAVELNEEAEDYVGTPIKLRPDGVASDVLSRLRPAPPAITDHDAGDEHR